MKNLQIYQGLTYLNYIIFVSCVVRVDDLNTNNN